MTREPHPIDAILPTLGGIQTIVEIGCHRMEDTAFLRATFPKAVIVAFEPDPRNVSYIRHKGLAETLRVQFVDMAVSDRDGLLDLYQSTNMNSVPARDWTRSSSIRRPKDFGDMANVVTGVAPCVFKDQPVTVTSVRLDSFFAFTRNMPDLIWCDAQSAEDLIITGARETLRHVSFLFLEHNSNGCYDGAPHLAALQAMLPGWETMHVWPYDALLRNCAT